MKIYILKQIIKVNFFQVDALNSTQISKKIIYSFVKLKNKRVTRL